MCAKVFLRAILQLSKHSLSILYLLLCNLTNKITPFDKFFLFAPFCVCHRLCLQKTQKRLHCVECKKLALHLLSKSKKLQLRCFQKIALIAKKIALHLLAKKQKKLWSFLLQKIVLFAKKRHCICLQKAQKMGRYFHLPTQTPVHLQKMHFSKRKFGICAFLRDV